MVKGFSGASPPTFFECLPHVQRLVACNIELSRPAVSPTGQAHDSQLKYPHTKPFKGSASTTCYAHPLPIAGRAVW